jgi:hypothetical protein
MEARMSTHFGSYSTHSNTLSCPGCGANGTLKWEDTPGGEKELVAIEGRFYERLARKAPHAIELVCDDCGTVQKAA